MVLFLESRHQYELAIRLGGYNPARGTFEEEYDDQAECLLELLNESTWINKTTKTTLKSNLLQEKLNATIIDIFNERLQERYRRKQIIKDYGLVAFNKHQLWMKSMEVLAIIHIYIYLFSKLLYILINFRLYWVQK